MWKSYLFINSLSGTALVLNHAHESKIKQATNIGDDSTNANESNLVNCYNLIDSLKVNIPHTLCFVPAKTNFI